MGVHVIQEERLLLERCGALVALERLLPRMIPHVHLSYGSTFEL